ncbi:MAG: transglycosylase family protein [Acidimicrobiia bacterium]|nr:transglycosylase family protein [Acidimicrobiia bacterium]
MAVVIALLAIATTGAVPASGAQATGEPVEAARASVDEIAVRWFAAQVEADEIEQRLAVVERRVEIAEEQTATTLEIATARALQIYKGAGATFPDLIAGDDALQSARRVELIDRANAESDAAMDDLAAVTEDLRAERAELTVAREKQATVLTELEAERSDLVAALDAAIAADRATASAAAARRAVGASARAAASTPAPPPPASSTALPEVAPPAGSGPAVTSTVPPADAGDSGGTVESSEPAAPTAGVHPRHDEPFLVCTRARESGGSYTAVNPAGYYGAYQFSPLTWDATASHAGRLELAGVLPSRASEYDQDDLAWVLYQWQGNTPWGGRC